MNAGEHNFLDASCLGSQGIPQDITSQSAAPLPPRQPGDAVRAEIITTILHLDKAARARVGTGERLARDGFLIKNRWFQIQHLADQVVLIEVVNYPFHIWERSSPVSYTHLRAHETVLDLVCRLLLEKKKINHY